MDSYECFGALKISLTNVICQCQWLGIMVSSYTGHCHFQCFSASKSRVSVSNIFCTKHHGFSNVNVQQAVFSKSKEPVKRYIQYYQGFRRLGLGSSCSPEVNIIKGSDGWDWAVGSSCSPEVNIIKGADGWDLAAAAAIFRQIFIFSAQHKL